MIHDRMKGIATKKKKQNFKIETCRNKQKYRHIYKSWEEKINRNKSKVKNQENFEKFCENKSD